MLLSSLHEPKGTKKMRTSTNKLAAILVGVVIGGVGLVNSVQAATCIAVSPFTNPDATLTNSGPCGPGLTNDANDSQADVRTATGDNAWTLVGSVGAPLFLTFTGTQGGSWFIAASAPDDTDFLIVIKDGAAPGGAGDSISWVWFDVDTSIPCANTAFDYCGTWTMYGDGGTLKDISHMSLYSQPGDDRNGVVPVPEPATLGLLGAALLAFTLSRRRRS